MNGFAALDIHPHRRYVVDIGGRRSSRCRLHINFALFLHSLDFTQNLGVTLILMSKADLLISQMIRLPENRGLESYIIATIPQKADRKLSRFQLVRIANISFLHHSSLHLTLEAISLSST